MITENYDLIRTFNFMEGVRKTAFYVNEITTTKYEDKPSLLPQYVEVPPNMEAHRTILGFFSMLSQ